MNAELLLAHYDRISDAPDAVARLRKFILDLAVRGKLVQSSPERTPIPKSSETPENGKSATFLDGSRQDWIRGTVGQFLNFQYGKALPDHLRQETAPVPVFGSNGIVSYTTTGLSNVPAIIIGRKGSAGALNLCNGPSWTTDVAYFVEPPSNFNIRYLFFALLTLDLDKLGKGVKPGLSRADAYQLPLDIPPIQEQERIVAKVDGLMALCDRLEKAQREQETRREQLTASAHHHVNNGEDADGLRTHAQFFIGHLPRLAKRPDQIKQLRQTILDLAIRGLLTRNVNDGDGTSLLPASEVFERRISFPSTWSIQTLSEVASIIVDCPHSTPHWTIAGKICVRTNQFRPGFLNLTDVRYVSESTYIERIDRLKPIENDILYSREGGILGIACRIPPNTELCLGQRMMLIRSGKKAIPAYLELVLNSPLVTSLAATKTTGGAAPRINVATVKAYPIPIPPLAEQHRIVAKVGELMTLCDQLEASLNTARTETSRLLESVLHHALEASA